jgi:hypothetical protein
MTFLFRTRIPWQSCIPEYYLGGKVEFLGETWKNKGLGLALSTKTYIQNVIPKFEGLFARRLSPSRHT